MSNQVPQIVAEIWMNGPPAGKEGETNFHIRTYSHGPNYLTGKFYVPGTPLGRRSGASLKLVQLYDGSVSVEIGARVWSIQPHPAEQGRPLDSKRARVLIGRVLEHSRAEAAYRQWLDQKLRAVNAERG